MTEQRLVARPRAALLAMAVLAACSAGNSAPPVSFADTSWRLAELQSSDDAIGLVRPDDPAKYQMTLHADGTASLRLDCNRGTGRWTSTAGQGQGSQGQGTMTFTPLAMTRAACPPGSLDTRIARELGFVRTYLTEGDMLRLILMADGGTQLWSRIRQ